ncbi:hypothetical protein [Demequina oxidasica]|uniref:hypothetical protein n=1 Tax=Demequina oxidasica TaxID=676199 RepID=UPI000785C451|nr:hypothetical protein [Demequina oxidasica]
MTTTPTLSVAWDTATWTDIPGVAPLSWQGSDHHISEATLDSGERALRKAPRDLVPVLSCDAGSARVAAAEVGVGPRVLVYDASSGSTIEEHLGDRWRVATSLRLKNPEVLASFGRARMRFRTSEATLPVRDMLAEVSLLGALVADATGGTVPGDGLPSGGVAEAFALLPRLSAALADGPAPSPCWMSSEISDIQLGPDGAVLLTGGTAAGIADPLADVGAALAGLAPYCATAEDAFGALWDDDHPGAFARAVLWSIVADLRAALVSIVAHGSDPDAGYSMYALRRGWKLTFSVGADDLDTLLTTAQKGWK